jgi:hypothetical protein
MRLLLIAITKTLLTFPLDVFTRLCNLRTPKFLQLGKINSVLALDAFNRAACHALPCLFNRFGKPNE